MVLALWPFFERFFGNSSTEMITFYISFLLSFLVLFYRASTWQIFKHFPSVHSTATWRNIKFSASGNIFEYLPPSASHQSQRGRKSKTMAPHNTELKGKLFSLFCSLPQIGLRHWKGWAPVLFLCGSLYLEINAIHIVVVHSSRRKKKHDWVQFLGAEMPHWW